MDIRKALEILGLPSLVTRREIKERYRQLARRYHPDRDEGDAARMGEINRAYETLMEYVENFRFRFDEEEINRHNPQASLNDKFKM
ncbi:J domain-containing protein [Nitratifractor salsuginis]|uniref:Heat shock protein DnaJ domain protein n=1 Tax=Nitratifractor salsuginis (strain DSM 16511 / JCM 12458 / E9I37-1) TaxID=749222 RepID=E6X0E0_NITSE|nr:J domain-containing protein [Nitratifractor salsuginis]ADV45729.1 heat shock protein DnaJ domain protein [Nitratifractor salsuginis DSM 16511]